LYVITKKVDLIRIPRKNVHRHRLQIVNQMPSHNSEIVLLKADAMRLMFLRSGFAPRAQSRPYTTCLVLPGAQNVLATSLFLSEVAERVYRIFAVLCYVYPPENYAALLPIAPRVITRKKSVID
jgi:hypothetical protein